MSTNVKQITPQQTSEILQSEKDVVYLDVRTAPEFQNGHVPGARNIPIVFPDPKTRRMTLNPDFLNSVESMCGKDTKIICGCQMGGRSQHAAELLVHAGYTDVSNMQGGFGGVRDPMGNLVAPGWLQLGFPVET
jgi:rhodanese-related sulfurtransferase